MSACAAFTCFPRLPAELRLQIWMEVLPPEDGPAVYPYHWRWPLKHGGPGGEQRAPCDGADHERYVEVCTVPELVFVSREARAAVIEWARARGYAVRLREETQGHCVVRPWEPERDVLYVGRDQWDEFCDHPYHEGARWALDMAASIRHLAVPAFTAYYSYEELGMHLFHYMPNLVSLSAVWGRVIELRPSRGRQQPPLSEHHERGHYAEVQPRWEMEDITDRDEPVTLAALDHTNRSMIYEEGNLDEWMDEIDTEMALLELPERFVDADAGRLTLELLAVTAAQKSAR